MDPVEMCGDECPVRMRLAGCWVALCKQKRMQSREKDELNECTLHCMRAPMPLCRLSWSSSELVVAVAAYAAGRLSPYRVPLQVVAAVGSL